MIEYLNWMADHWLLTICVIYLILRIGAEIARDTRGKR